MRAANRNTFTAEEWDAMRRWMRRHVSEIEAVGSCDSVRDSMLRDGVKCNQRATIEAAKFLGIKFAIAPPVLLDLKNRELAPSELVGTLFAK